MHGAMPRPQRVNVHDIEQGKRDDDRKSSPTTPRWNAATVPRFRKRRWAAFILALGVLYLFFTNIPEGLGPVNNRIDIRIPGRLINGRPVGSIRNPQPKSPPEKPSAKEPLVRPVVDSEEEKVTKPTQPVQKSPKSGKMPKPDDEGAGPLHYYNGEIEFPVLTASLQAQSSMLGYSFLSSVLFAASNLESAAVLIPMACEMARAKRNVVNFAYFGRDDLTIDEIKEANGVALGCEIVWHDARPQHSVYSSDERFKNAVKEALDHISAYSRPEAYFMVDGVHEEKQLIDALRAITVSHASPLIEVPYKVTDNLKWMTRLDAKSLAHWNKIDIDVLIQVKKEDSGGLARLLKSLAKADYRGLRTPHITFDIPADLDIPSENIINQFVWPPAIIREERKRSQVAIRKRIPHHKISPLESAIQTVEAFYPINPAEEHLMILTSNVELSPMWYHYLLFNTLEYAYSGRSMAHVEAGNLAGISLLTPMTGADQRQPFELPKLETSSMSDSGANKPKFEAPDTVPFMWQFPDTMAVLYYGHKWKEFHSFLSRRIGAASTSAQRKMAPSVSPFAEPLNELMELRGWHVLYPNLPAHHIATYRPVFSTREEYLTLPPRKDGLPNISIPDKDVDPYVPSTYEQNVGGSYGGTELKTLADSPIHTIIPNKGILPDLNLLPVLNGRGQPTSAIDLLQNGARLQDKFRLIYGGCQAEVVPQGTILTADDLFCDGSGDPFSGSQEELEAIAFANQEEQRLQEEELKANALGDATPALYPEDDKESASQVHDEFLKHLQRQGSEAIINKKAETKAAGSLTETIEAEKLEKAEESSGKTTVASKTEALEAEKMTQAEKAAGLKDSTKKAVVDSAKAITAKSEGALSSDKASTNEKSRNSRTTKADVVSGVRRSTRRS